MQEKRLLIVDDDARIGRLAQRALKSAELVSQVLDDPLAFESVYASFRPDIILLDLQMAQRDGVQLLRYLADQDSSAGIVLMSGIDERIINTSKRLGESLGLNILATLQKPLELAALQRVLEAFYRAERSSPSVIQLIAQGELEEAIHNGAILPYYQPQLDLRTLQVTGAEVLARWHHPQHGLLPPADFIALAESTGLIEALTFSLLRQALQDFNFLLAVQPGLRLSVNLSPLLLEDLELPERIHTLLEDHGVEPSQLALEITESVRAPMPSRSMDILTRLRLKGIALSYDDLGKGYASVDQLYYLPFSELKVDKEYVIDLRRSADAAAIVRSTIELGQRLNLRVVAEGIETSESLMQLRALGCHAGQGRYFSLPLPLREILGWLERWQQRRAGLPEADAGGL
ncbi:MAG TPA: EAL domain-containing response regulator [Candidatus Competibacteraceae bacterium]|nr:EAL domain-containing response regulator [Candidatus Competibacteraceae bacterium]